ncbi:Topoisomerase 1-associated factor 1 [Recurvomyces mirabilis]|uniref:Topoisomerase 1-associated factor 1 n=1 Tax=Recurvomyces mirabilis TaxID=574656 RepID=A0AAE0WJQ8_9PEZI|nr:Topoisomerase 1-associated factor 1 [Recurvomyces mirabilis]KAK5150934.1 Topoisomerase 1-associated factor 1 [Recurvomyces mirabilis]
MEEIWEKSQTVDPEVRAYVYSLVTAVGGSSSYDDTYQVGDDAYAALQDLTKWLRLYDEKLNRFDVKRCLAEANLVKGDLLEILALWPESTQENKLKAKLALACLQLLVPLTWPMELEDEKTTVNHHRHLPYLQLAQVGYKRAILHYEHAKILRTSVRIGLPSMSVERRERTKRDEGIIRLMLYLFRNMAMIVQPQMLPSQGDENEISRSSTVDVFHDQDIFSLLLTLGSGANDEFQDQDVILLEILFHLLKGVDAKKLFMEQKQMQAQETDELKSLMQREKAMHKGYNRHAPSRHNRFGTMLWVKREDEKMSTLTGQASIVDGDATLQMMDQSKKWNKPRQRGKIAQQTNEQTDFGEKVELTETARQHLRSFTEDFLDSGFNPLFSSLRKAIERETDRVGEVHKRQYFYLINWFLSAESARRSQAEASQRPLEDSTFAYIAAVLDQETFVLLNRHMQRFFDEKNWIDLQSTLLAFTQILLTVQTMAESKDEEDQEIAENIQNRIFYEEATHDRIVQILRGYTNQGFAYLDTVTECVHVFVRMLERYSKQNADLHIRSKRRARKKASKQSNTTGQDDPEDAAEEERSAHATVSERKFDFSRFSAKFLSQPCVDTFISLLYFYADLNPDQLKRCHRYFYRLAFKHELAILLFRVDILQLLHRMVKGPRGLSTEIDGYKDWEALVQQVFRRCVKWLSKDVAGDGWKEMCVTEMLFSKIPASVFYLQNGYERVVEKRAPRAPAELEFKGTVEEAMKVPVIVSLLLEQSKGEILDWVKREFERAIEERKAWEAERAAMSSIEREAEGECPHIGAVLPPPTIFLSRGTDERKEQLFKDKHLRLLLTTIGCERLGTVEDADASWTIPSDLSTEEVTEGLAAIKRTEFDPPHFEEGKTAAEMVRNKSAVRRVAINTYDSADDEDTDGNAGAGAGAGESDVNVDASLFPPNLRESRKETDGEERPSKRRRLTKRTRTELTDAQADERAAERRRREKERNSKIKSRLFVTESDDESDADADAEFFRLEAERRRKTAGEIRSALLKRMEEGDGEEGGVLDVEAGKKEKGKSKQKRGSAADAGARGKRAEKRRKTASPLATTDDEMEDDEDLVGASSSEAEETAPRPTKRRPIFEEDSDVDTDTGADAATATAAPTATATATVTEAEPAAIVSQTRQKRPAMFEEDSDEDDGDAMDGVKPHDPASPAQKALKEVSGNAGLSGTLLDGLNDRDEDEHDVPLVKPIVRRGTRAGFVVEDDSDSDDE